ncbi:protein phosphatase 2C domain-containing protein [Streptomyces sp. NPDC006251]|uniref:protein phosphatase 2C domain-containing protein n=1 Tax=Streptomyces sp. NPDC006251 TaxID=3155718 RepID=UPI0033BD2AC6
MSQQGGRPTGHEDDWWGQLYDDSTGDTGPAPAPDSLDDRFASAAGAVGDQGVSPASDERPAPGTDMVTDRPYRRDTDRVVPMPRAGADEARETPPGARPADRAPDQAPDRASGRAPDQARDRPSDRAPWRAPWEPPPGRPTGPVTFPTPAKPPGRAERRPEPPPTGGTSSRPGPSGSPGPSGNPGATSAGAASVSSSAGTGAPGPSGSPGEAPGGRVPESPSDAAGGPPQAPGAPAPAPPPEPPRPSESPRQTAATTPPPPALPPSWPVREDPSGAVEERPEGVAPPTPSDKVAPPTAAAEPGSSAFLTAAGPPPAAPPPMPLPPTEPPSDRPDPQPGGYVGSRPPTEPPSDTPTPRIEPPATGPRPRGYVGSRPPTYDAEPTALPVADPDDLDDLVADTVLDGARYGACTLRAVSVRGDSARYRGEPRRDSLLTARFGTGEHALLLVAMATGARATPGAHRAAAEACHWIGRAVGRSHSRLVEDIRAGRRGDLKSGLHRLTDRSLGKLRASAAEQGVDPEEYAAGLRCLLLPADPECRTRVFFGVGPGGLFRLREGEWQDIEPQVTDIKGEPVLGFGSPPSETPEGDRLTMDLGIPTPPSPYEPAPEPPREPFRFRTSVARPGDTLLMCSSGLADPLRGEPELCEYLADRWSRPEPPGLAAFLADSQVRVKGYADDRTAAAVWEA